MARFLYTLALIALLPWALLHLLWRGRRQPEYRQQWGERFGFYPPPPPSAAPRLWLHAVSVGETRAAQPLITALRAHYPNCSILLTHMTPTGRATAGTLFSDSVTSVYLPYDTPWAIQRFLRHFQPCLGLILETELWPNLVAACRHASLPLLLVNARLSEKSARRYARWPALTRQTLQQLTAISAISTTDAARLRALGTLDAPSVSVAGNLKFDIAPPTAQLALGQQFRARNGNRPIFLCASTRQGEEALILAAWTKLGASRTALLVIVPRHPQRFAAVAQLIESHGLKWQRRSDEADVEASTQVWLGDSMGELFAYYAAAEVVFVGGSLLDFGSQNLIEPCAVGVPVLIGPSTFNFAEAAQAAVTAGATCQVGNADALVEQALTLLADAARRKTMGQAGLNFVSQHRGATARTLALVARYMPDSA